MKRKVDSQDSKNSNKISKSNVECGSAEIDSVRAKWVEILKNRCPPQVTEDETERHTWAEELENAIYQIHAKDKDLQKRMTTHIQMIVSNLRQNPHYLATFNPSQIAGMNSAELANKPWYVKHQCEAWKASVVELPPGLSPRSAWNTTGRECRLFFTVLSTRSGLVDIFNEHFKDIPRVSTVIADILNLDGDAKQIQAFVSPANSFGNMDGGIDREYAEHFGWPFGRPYDSINPLQRKIDQEYGLEQDIPIGEALIVPVTIKKDFMDSRSVKYLIAAPTMTRPEALSIGSRNVYQAALAAFREWRRHNNNVRNSKGGEEIFRVAMPLFGTGVGDVPAIIAIKQMHEAFIDAWT